MLEILKSSALIIIFSLSLLASTQSQQAPNFTISDTDGQIHRLYEDYLNQGKTVVIKMFFVNCPPCTAIAPAFQNLYEEWGEGQYDVEFFELSTKSFDSNAEVASYKNGLGLTFPAAGEDGGAYSALQPYLTGQFGPYYGAPTFVVIAPDKTVNYDVSGNGQTNTINAIDQAITNTGAQKPGSMVLPSSFTIVIEDVFGNEIESPEIYLSQLNSSLEIPINLNSNSAFEITDLNQEYPGLTNPVIRVRKTDDLQDKLSAIDILVIVRHILGLIPIQSSELQIAADTNGDGFINAIDLITLQRAILGQINMFPNSDSYMITPLEIPIFLSPGDNQQLNFEGIKIGDLNGF